MAFNIEIQDDSKKQEDVEEVDVTTINCCNCGRKLFDAEEKTDGAIRIKCLRCKTIMVIRFMNRNRKKYNEIIL